MAIRIRGAMLAGVVVAAMVGLWAVRVAGAVSAQDALPSNCTQTGQTVTCTYTTAGQGSFTVPGGVSSVDVVAVGAAGGAGLGGGGGGEGASVEDMAVPVGG